MPLKRDPEYQAFARNLLAQTKARQTAEHPMHITTTQGMSGNFAVMMWWNPDMGGFWEPFETGMIRGTLEQATKEAEIWAQFENIPFVKPGEPYPWKSSN